MNDQDNLFSKEDHHPGDTSGLTGIYKTNPFRAPDGYFEELPRLIHKRCPPIFADQSKSWGFFANYRALLLIAVIIVAFAIALFILVVNPWRSATNRNPEETTDFILKEAQSGYFFRDIDDSVIYNLASGEFVDYSITLGNTECSADEIITYLVDENIDLETIDQL